MHGISCFDGQQSVGGESTVPQGLRCERHTDERVKKPTFRQERDVPKIT